MDLGNTVQFNSLKWVKEELRLLINEIHRHLEAFVSSEEKDVDHLVEIVSILRQVRGTLALVEIHGAALLCEEMELLVKALQANKISNKANAFEVLTDAVIRLLSYLDSLILGEKDVPLLLLPILNDLRACRNENLLSENVLFFPDVKQDTGAYKLPGLREKKRPEAIRELAKRIRYSFQQGLLGWFRDKDRELSLGKMKAVLARLLDNAKVEKSKRLWWLSATIVEALEYDAVESSVALKLILGQVDRQIKQLSEVSEEQLVKKLPQELIRNILYYLARAEPASELIANAKAQFNLAKFLPASGYLSNERRLAGPNKELLDAVKVAVDEDIAQAKDVLDIYSLSDQSDTKGLEPLQPVLLKIADTLAMLGLGHTRQSIKNQLDILQVSLKTGKVPDQDELMAIAATLLVVDNDLDAFVSKRITSTDTHEDMAQSSRAVENLKVIGVLINEALRNLSRVKDGFIEYLSHPQEITYIANLNAVLQELDGAMRVASLDQVIPILSELKKYFSSVLRNHHTPKPAEQDVVADVVTNIECYLEAVSENRLDTELFIAAGRAAAAKLNRVSDNKQKQAEQVIEVDLLELADDVRPATRTFSKVGDFDEEVELPDVPELSVKTALRDVRPPARDTKDYESLQIMGDDSDEEILNIFIEEALEELSRISELFPIWKQNPKNSDAVTTIRRSFHTLKGSGRLVGAALIGEFSWCMESMFNRLIEGTVQVSSEIFNVVEEAIGVLPQLIEQITGNRQPIKNVFKLMRRADQLSSHQYTNSEDSPKKKYDSPIYNSASNEEDGELVIESDTGDYLADPFASILDSTEPEELTLSGFDEPAIIPGATDSITIEPQSVDPILLDIFTEESKTHLATIDNFIAGAARSPEGAAGTSELIRALHTLHGSAKTAKFHLIAAVANYLEQYANNLKTLDTSWFGDKLELLEEAVRYIRTCLEYLADHTSEMLDEEHIGSKLRAALKETQQQLELHESANRAESTAYLEEADHELIEVFLEEGMDLMGSLESELQLWLKSKFKKQHIEAMMRDLHTLKGSARMANLGMIGDICHSIESLFIAFMSGAVEPSEEHEPLLHGAMDQLVALMGLVQQGKPMVLTADITGMLNRVRLGESAIAELEEDSLTPVNAIAEPDEDSLTSVDELPEIDMSPKQKIQVPSATESFKMQAVDVEEQMQAHANAGLAQQEQVRIRADKLDHLVNYAGEVNIYHSRIARHMTDFNFNLGEFTQTVDRLKNQLRDMEIQTEAQIASRYEREHESPDAEFDPLEMDRYSHMQQLSRSLAESANDLENLKDSMFDLVRDSETLLQQQARISTDLQDGLMQTRMVRFEGIAARLRRVVRQTAQETNKKVDLQILGLETEIDRSVQEKMLAPLEHILRNAVFHGIEVPAKRATTGKTEMGHIQISIGRDGSYIVLNIMDDGQGINIDAVRNKAIEKKLISKGDKLPDAEIIRFILHKGFSTATDVTQIAGRGVGMDVVDSEIKQLGGSLAINSKQGKGTLFSIRLPLTLAINQALIVKVGVDVYAIPLTDIEGVARINGKQLEENLGGYLTEYEYAGQTYQMSYLGALLGNGVPENINADGLYPLLMLRISDKHIAVGVEEMLGRREVVVKPVGPQISNMAGISGATILADGHVALILDMAGLFQDGEVTSIQAPIVMEQDISKVNDDLTVMIIDDSITIRKVTARILGRHNLKVMTAKDGLDAVTQLQDQIPDLLLMDIEMPRMDGFELATHVRADARLQNIPIIMITSRTGEKHRERAARIGVDRYLGKPFQENDLMHEINELLERAS